ncbi:MAG: tripartite tricarboxylate transporter substrate binding protein [Burkholderiales bacterium]|nr:tripartite tricarboxylate transporter substrate binding protein [Burkholderiales bacterium]
MDTATRTMKQILDAAKLLSAPSVVINKPGAGGAIAYQYLNQNPGSGRHLALASPSLITNRLMAIGDTDPRDVTPVATLFSENIVFMVRTDSSITDGKALIARLKKDPGSVAWGIATALGGANHIAAASVMKAAGIDPGAAHNVIYKAGSAALVGLLGGEVEVVPVATLVSLPQLAAGKVRVIAISSPERLGGALANVPTWTELGVNAIYTSWRMIIAPRGTNSADARAAAATLEKMAATPQWKAEVGKNYWISRFLGPEATQKFLADQMTMHAALLGQLKLSK